MACDLTNGRLLNECLSGRAGIKTLIFIKLQDWLDNGPPTIVAGEITALPGAGPVPSFRFELGDNVGNWEQAVTASGDNGTSFVTQTLLMTLFQITPADLDDLNNLKRGRWVILALDFDGKIRAFGIESGCTANGGSETSGTAAADKKGLDMSFTAQESDYAPFMADYTTVPLDNFANITVSPAYP